MLEELYKVSEDILGEDGSKEEIYIKAMLALIQTYESMKEVCH
jgi:hypothetical protein